MSEVHEIADGIYRIAAFNPGDPIMYSQFLIKDEKPLLFHTGQRAIFQETLEAGTLFASALFTQCGKSPPITESDVVQKAVETHKAFPDYLPVGPHTARVFERLEALQPKVIAGHHAPAYAGDAVRALRDLRTAVS